MEVPVFNEEQAKLAAGYLMPVLFFEIRSENFFTIFFVLHKMI